MEAGFSLYGFAFLGQVEAAFADDIFEVFDGWDVLVDDRFVDESPKRFGRLQFGRIGRQEHEAQALRNLKAGLGMPAGAVEREDDDALVACSRLFGEERKQRFEKWLGNAVVHIPENLTGRRRDEGGDIEPFKAVMAMSDGPLADRRPDAPRHRLQAEAMLIPREDFDGFLGVFGRFRCSDFADVFLKAAASSGVAD